MPLRFFIAVIVLGGFLLGGAFLHFGNALHWDSIASREKLLRLERSASALEELELGTRDWIALSGRYLESRVDDLRVRAEERGWMLEASLQGLDGLDG